MEVRMSECGRLIFRCGGLGSSVWEQRFASTDGR